MDDFCFGRRRALLLPPPSASLFFFFFFFFFPLFFCPCSSVPVPPVLLSSIFFFHPPPPRNGRERELSAEARRSFGGFGRAGRAGAGWGGLSFWPALLGQVPARTWGLWVGSRVDPHHTGRTEYARRIYVNNGGWGGALRKLSLARSHE